MSDAVSAGAAFNMTGTAFRTGPTTRLYEENAYLAGCEATVLAVYRVEDQTPQGERDSDEREKNNGTGPVWEVILDRTVFFPEGGGQSPDTGWIISYGRGRVAGCTYRVTDVQIADGVIRHTVTAVPSDTASDDPEAKNADSCGQEFSGPAAGDTVTIAIDWERRFGFMQNHTGEHILSGLMHSRYGFDNIGFHLSDHSVTVDVNGQLDEEEILALEREANEVIYRNAEVEILYPSEKELPQYVYRSKIEIEGQVRLVRIPDVDLCACCATHVRRTGQIGLIKIVRTVKFNGGMRLFILCGRRAFEMVQRPQQCVEEVSHLTNRSRDEIGDGVRHLLDEIGSLKQKNRELEYKAASLRIDAIPAEQENAVLFVGEMDAIVQRNMVNRLMEEHSGICGVFCGDDEAGYRYIIGSRTLDARETQKKLREKLGAKGGGKPAMVQGSVSGTKASVEEVLLS